MKKTIVLAMVLTFASCSNDSDELEKRSECKSELIEISNKYDQLIELAYDDYQQQKRLIYEKEAKLESLNCDFEDNVFSNCPERQVIIDKWDLIIRDEYGDSKRNSIYLKWNEIRALDCN